MYLDRESDAIVGKFKENYQDKFDKGDYYIKNILEHIEYNIIVYLNCFVVEYNWFVETVKRATFGICDELTDPRVQNLRRSRANREVCIHLKMVGEYYIPKGDKFEEAC